MRVESKSKQTYENKSFLTSYSEIYEMCKEPKNRKMRINSPQTARNICEAALRKIKESLSSEQKKELAEFLDYF